MITNNIDSIRLFSDDLHQTLSETFAFLLQTIPMHHRSELAVLQHVDGNSADSVCNTLPAPQAVPHQRI